MPKVSYLFLSQFAGLQINKKLVNIMSQNENNFKDAIIIIRCMLTVRKDSMVLENKCSTFTTKDKRISKPTRSQSSRFSAVLPVESIIV